MAASEYASQLKQAVEQGADQVTTAASKTLKKGAKLVEKAVDQVKDQVIPVKLVTKTLDANPPAVPDGVKDILSLLGSAKVWTGTAATKKFTRKLLVSPITNPSVIANPPYDSEPNYQYLVGIAVQYTSNLTSGEFEGSVNIDEGCGYLLFDISNTKDGKIDGTIVYYLVTNFHGVNILYSGNLASSTVTQGDYGVSMTAQVPTGLSQTPHLTPLNKVTDPNNPPKSKLSWQGPWKLDISFKISNKSFVFTRSNNPHPATITFEPNDSFSHKVGLAGSMRLVRNVADEDSKENERALLITRTTKEIDTIPSVPTPVSYIISLLANKTWIGNGDDTQNKTTFQRNMVITALGRNIITNPAYSDPYDPSTTVAIQYLAGVMVNYDSRLTKDGKIGSKVIDQGCGYWLFDYSDYVSSSSPVIEDIKVYYILSNFHGVCILYQGKLTGGNGKYVSNMTAFYNNDGTVATGGLIQTAFLNAKNSKYVENNAWSLDVTFDTLNNTFGYVRSNNPHPATINFTVSQS